MTHRYRIFARMSLAVMALATIVPLAASAATVTSGTLALGDPRPGQTTSYTFSASGFTTATAISCIQLRLAAAADGTGAITGLTTTGSTFGSTTIAGGTWTVNNGVNGSLRATNATPTTPNASGNIVWNAVVSGSTANTTYYGLFNTYTNTDCATGPVDSTVVAFTYKDGALVSLTVDPTLTFTVAGVTAPAAVNTVATTLTSTATAIDFARTVTTAANGVSAHDLTVATNANGGFTVNLRQTGGLTNGTQTIAPWTGTNASPTPFPAVNNEAWGYTTEDATLAGVTANRFTSASNWAGMPTTNELVMDNTTVGSQTTRVGHQLGIADTTRPGNYSTTLVYSAAGSY